MKLYSNVSIIVFLWMISVFTIFYFSFFYLPSTNKLSSDFLERLSNWDGAHYLQIAKNGYKEKLDYIFFPLYPLLMKFIKPITGDYFISGLLISLVSFLIATNFLYHLVALDFGKFYAQRALLCILFFPLSFHFLTVYTESLFLLLSLLTFIFLRQKKYLLSAIFASLGSVTRLSGIALVFSLILSVYFTEGLNKKNWYVILSPLGLLMYCIFLYRSTGDPFYFIQSESQFWKSGLVLPGSALLFSLKQLLKLGFITNNFRNLADFVFAVFGIFFVWKIIKKLSLDYALFSIVSLILPLFSPTIVAIPRYLITIFPIFIILGLNKNFYFSIFYQFLGLMLLSVYSIFFINGYWVS